MIAEDENNQTHLDVYLDEDQNKNIFRMNFYQLNKMKHKIEEDLQNKQIWNGDLLKDLVSKSEDYLANQYIQVIFLGMKGSGKTTLINSLLGDEIIPLKFNNLFNNEIIIQVGFRNDHLFSVTKCNPQTFKPINEENDIQYYENIKDIYSFIEQQLLLEQNTNSSQQKTQEEYFFKNQTCKTFEIRVNSTFFENFPHEIRSNIFLVDTPGINIDQRYQQQIFINQLKNISQNNQRTIKNYVWVTNLAECEQTTSHEKTLIENVCSQLHLQDKNQKQIIQQQLTQDLNLNQEYSNNQIQQQDQKQLAEHNLFINNQTNRISSSSESQKINQDEDLNFFLNQVCQEINKYREGDQLYLKNSNSISELESINNLRKRDFFHSDKVNEDDFQIIDEEVVKIDDMENRLRNEQICFLEVEKVNRQLCVVINIINEEQNVFIQKNTSKIEEYKNEKLTKSQIKFKTLIEKCFKVITVSVLPSLMCQIYTKYKNNQKKEEEIASKFYQAYKQSLNFKNLKEAKTYLRNINFEQQYDINLVNNNKNEQQQTYRQYQNNFFIKQTKIIDLDILLNQRINDLYNYKQQKRRFKIQAIIDKSSQAAQNIFLNEDKKVRIGLFIEETLNIIKINHQNLINFELSQLFDSTLDQRYNCVIAKIEEIYSKHKSYNIFDKVEKELDSTILEYFSESVKSLELSMSDGNKLIDLNKNQILQEIYQIDPHLEEGIRFILIDLKKRSLNNANHLINSKIFISLYETASHVGTIIGTSSIFTGLGLVLQRLISNSMIGSGPMGLGIAFGASLASIIFAIKNREKTLGENKQHILDLFKTINNEQKKIHEQLIQSYLDVQNQIIKVISDYLQGIADINKKQFLDEQKILGEQNNILYSKHLQQNNETDESSDTNSDLDSEDEILLQNQGNSLANEVCFQFKENQQKISEEYCQTSKELSQFKEESLQVKDGFIQEDDETSSTKNKCSQSNYGCSELIEKCFEPQQEQTQSNQETSQSKQEFNQTQGQYQHKESYSQPNEEYQLPKDETFKSNEESSQSNGVSSQHKEDCSDSTDENSYSNQECSQSKEISSQEECSLSNKDLQKHEGESSQSEEQYPQSNNKFSLLKQESLQSEEECIENNNDNFSTTKNKYENSESEEKDIFKSITNEIKEHQEGQELFYSLTEQENI